MSDMSKKCIIQFGDAKHHKPIFLYDEACLRGVVLSPNGLYGEIQKSQ